MVDDNKLDRKRYDELVAKEQELDKLKEQNSKVEIVDDSLEKDAEKKSAESFNCPKCNSSIEPKQDVCPACGAKLKWED